MEYRSRTSPEQFAALLKFMERHGDLGRPQAGPQARIRLDHLWIELEKHLNSIHGGVTRSIEKWKKVWADWKTKTKKKALAIHNETSGAGDGSSTKQTLTNFELRLLAVIGLSAIIVKTESKENGYENLPSDISHTPPHENSVHSDISGENKMVLDVIPIHYLQERTDSSSSLRILPPSELTSGVTPSPDSASRSVSPQCRQAPIVPKLRCRRFLQDQTFERKTRAPVEQFRSQSLIIEQRRLQLREAREKHIHEREMQRLRLESRRIEVEEKRNEVLNHLTKVLAEITDILPRVISPSLPSTDILTS